MATRATLPKRWTLNDQQLHETASIRDGLTFEQEQKLRRQACGFIQELGEFLNYDVPADNRGKLSQLCMTAAMTHLHRFFVHHSFKMFDGRDVAAAVLFLAGKTEECPRKLEHVVRAWFRMKYPRATPLDPKTDRYTEAAGYIVTLENIVLMTVAFDLNVGVPHADVVSFFTSKYFAELLKYNKSLDRQIQSKDVAEVAYFYASDILHVTTFVLQHPPNVLSAVVCYLAILHSGMEVQLVDGVEPEWWKRIAPNLNKDTLNHIANVFVDFYEANKDSLMLNRMRVKRERTQATEQKQQQQHQLTPATTPTSTSGVPARELDRPPSPPSMLNMKRVKTEPSIKIDMATYMANKAKRQTVGPDVPPPSTASFIPDVRNAVMPTHEPQSPPLSADVLAPPPKSAEQLAADAKEKERRARHAAEKEKRRRYEEHKRREAASASSTVVPPPPPMPQLTGGSSHADVPRSRPSSSSRPADVGRETSSSKERKRTHDSTSSSGGTHHRHSGSRDHSADVKRPKHESSSKSSRPVVSNSEQMSRMLNGSDKRSTVPSSKPLVKVSNGETKPSVKTSTGDASNGKPRAPLVGGDLEDGELSD